MKTVECRVRDGVGCNQPPGSTVIGAADPLAVAAQTPSGESVYVWDDSALYFGGVSLSLGILIRALILVNKFAQINGTEAS